jgi:hypothetical protein
MIKNKNKDREGYQKLEHTCTSFASLLDNPLKHRKTVPSSHRNQLLWGRSFKKNIIIFTPQIIDHKFLKALSLMRMSPELHANKYVSPHVLWPYVSNRNNYQLTGVDESRGHHLPKWRPGKKNKCTTLGIFIPISHIAFIPISHIAFSLKSRIN